MRSAYRALGVCLAVAAASLASSAQAARQWFDAGATPSRYEISVTPDVAGGVFAGEVRIAVTTSEELASVTMNAADLTINEARIDGTRATASLNEEAQTLTLTPRRALAAGEHEIRITYQGKIRDEAYGLFRVSYKGEDGSDKRAIATQFEPGDARRFAPMWDQPNRRAVFSLTVTAPSAEMVVSNMPVQSATPLRNGKTRTTFQDTPAMASYLLFMASGDFERATMDVDGVELGVVVRRGALPRGQEALRAGAESLRFYNEYFGIKFPLPKLDMIAVPGAGGFGAMENWGAILYFDQYLLVDADRSSATEKQNVFGIVAHEIAHQWFGDLVTMVWWDDLWLNEGFASWMAAKATERLHPDWAPWLDQMTDGTATAMTLDSRAGTHPIVQRVDTIDEANLAFDAITYQKGLAVIRMLEAYVGEDNFRQGVRDYLNAHLYGNAQTEDLWQAVQAASGQPVLEIAHAFTKQPGYPVLRTAAAACTRRRPNSEITLTQRRFAQDDTARTDELWTVPVVARRVGAEPVRHVLAAQAESTVAVGPGCGAYLVNAGQSGFFRVLYEPSNFTALTESFATLDSADQLGLLLDYWAFGRSGDAPLTNYLELTKRLPADADPVAVMDTAASLAALAEYAKGRPSEASVKAYARRVLHPYLERVGWEGAPDELSNVSKLRGELISTLGQLGDEEVIAEARRRVRASRENPAALPAAIRNAAIEVYAFNAEETDYEALLAQARAAQDFVEQRRLWIRLALANDPVLAQRTLSLTSGDEIPRQIRTQVINVLTGNHPRMGWDYLRSHRSEVEQLLDPLQRLEYPAVIASHSADPSVAEELRAYSADFPEGAKPTVAQAIASIELRAQTIAERMPAVEAWIARQR